MDNENKIIHEDLRLIKEQLIDLRRDIRVINGEIKTLIELRAKITTLGFVLVGLYQLFDLLETIGVIKL